MNAKTQTPTTKELFVLCKKRDWHKVTRHSKRKPQDARYVDKTTFDTPLHVACRYRPSARVVESLLKAFPESVLRVNHNGDIPLHVACRSNASLAVLRCLTKQYPSTARIPSTTCVESTSAVKILCNVFRSPDDANYRSTFWQKVRVLLEAAATDRQRNTSSTKLYLLHVAVEGSYPDSVLQYCLTRHPRDVRLKDATGMLPLHVAVNTRCSNHCRLQFVAKSSTIVRLLQAYPQAAGMIDPNEPENRFPLHTALLHGHHWYSGVKELAQTAPDAIGLFDSATKLYPFQMANDDDTRYQLLRQMPAVVLNLRFQPEFAAYQAPAPVCASKKLQPQCQNNNSQTEHLRSHTRSFTKVSGALTGTRLPETPFVQYKNNDTVGANKNDNTVPAKPQQNDTIIVPVNKNTDKEERELAPVENSRNNNNKKVPPLIVCDVPKRNDATQPWSPTNQELSIPKTIQIPSGIVARKREFMLEEPRKNKNSNVLETTARPMLKPLSPPVRNLEIKAQALPLLATPSPSHIATLYKGNSRASDKLQSNETAPAQALAFGPPRKYPSQQKSKAGQPRGRGVGTRPTTNRTIAKVPTAASSVTRGPVSGVRPNERKPPCHKNGRQTTHTQPPKLAGARLVTPKQKDTDQPIRSQPENHTLCSEKNTITKKPTCLDAVVPVKDKARNCRDEFLKRLEGMKPRDALGRSTKAQSSVSTEQFQTSGLKETCTFDAQTTSKKQASAAVVDPVDQELTDETTNDKAFCTEQESDDEKSAGVAKECCVEEEAVDCATVGISTGADKCRDHDGLCGLSVLEQEFQPKHVRPTKSNKYNKYKTMMARPEIDDSRGWRRDEHRTIDSSRFLAK